MTKKPKLDDVTRQVLSERAKLRRRALGMSCREVGEIAGVSAASVVQWERLLPQWDTHDVKWEAALRVPPGWLRNTSIETPPLPTGAFHAAESPELTFESFIRAACIWYTRPPAAAQTTEFESLSARERRIAEIMCRRYGSEGEARSTLLAIGEGWGLTRERVRQIADKASENFKQIAVPTALVERLHMALAPHLPCSLSDLPSEVQSILGGQQSLEGADRFFREFVGKGLVTIRIPPGPPTNSANNLVVADDSPDELLVRTIRQLAMGMIRQAGAAHVCFVAGAVSETGIAVAPADVEKCARMAPGFEWLIENEGWFWFGAGTDNRAKWTALKILSAANRPVDIEEVYAAMSRSRFSRSGERTLQTAVPVPMQVLQILLTKFVEIRPSHFNDYRLDVTAATLDEARAAYMSPSEMAIYATLVKHGGVATRRTLARELVDSGGMEKVTLDMGLMISPVFKRLDRRIWTIAGYSISYQALQRAQEERERLELVDGWYETEVSIPPSAFERGDWFVPAAATAHLSPGEYEVLGMPGSARYVVNQIGDPYLKRFALLAAEAGYEANVPCIFGIAATERKLRLRPAGSDEDQFADAS